MRLVAISDAGEASLVGSSTESDCSARVRVRVRVLEFSCVNVNMATALVLSAQTGYSRSSMWLGRFKYRGSRDTHSRMFVKLKQDHTQYSGSEPPKGSETKGSDE